MQDRQRSGGPLREVIDRGYDIDLRDRRVSSNRWNLLPGDAVIAKNAFRYAGERMQRFFIAAPVPNGVGNGLDDGLARATDASSPCHATGRPRKYSQIDSPQPRMRADDVDSAKKPHPPFGGTEQKFCRFSRSGVEKSVGWLLAQHQLGEQRHQLALARHTGLGEHLLEHIF
jgi:hypothetical protein